MLTIITYFFVPALTILIGFYLYVEAQRKKLIKANKRATLLRINKIKDTFKADLRQLVEQQKLTISGYESAYRIANNFFVFQPVTPNSIRYCDELLKNVISALTTGGPDSLNFDLVQEQINLFLRALPKAASGYNSDFYRNKLPNLINKLHDAQENIFQIDDEIIYQAAKESSNEATETSEPATAA